MILVDYPLKDEIVEALIAYERDNKSSLNTLIEDFLEDFLIKKGYLRFELPLEEIKTPAEIQSERKNHFKKVKQNKKIRLFYNDLDFSSHVPENIDTIINKLMEFTDNELELLSVNNYEGHISDYKHFLYGKLGMPTPTKLKIAIDLDKRYNTWRIRCSNGGNQQYYGSYKSQEEAIIVRAFLIKNIDNVKSSKEKGLKGKDYREYIYSKMKKEQSVLMEGK